MIKKIISCVFSLFFLFLFVSKVKADVGEAPGKGGVITSGDKSEYIEMRSEEVVFDIKYQDEDSPFYDEESDARFSPFDQYAEVNARFEMYNTSDSEVEMELMFPVHEIPFIDSDIYDEESKFNQSLNYSVLVNGKEVDYKHEVYKMASYQMDPNYENEAVHSLTFKVSFPSKEKTNIVISYDTRLVYEPKSIYGTFNYIMETGSHWKGDIGSGKVIFRFPSEINEGVFLEYNDFFEIRDNDLVWEFENLEPDEVDNIRVSYSPKFLDRWNQKPEELTSIKSYGDIELELENIPDEEKYSDISELGWWYHVETSPLFVLPEKDQTFTSGWLAEFREEDRPWIKLEFEGTYKIRSMEVLNGFNSTAYSIKEDPTKFFSLLSRPKALSLEFSDGTSQRVNLVDNPEELQKISFEEVETSFVKVTIEDVYAGETVEENILGIGSLEFEIGEEVAQDVNGDEGSNQETSKTVQNQTDEEKGFSTGLIIALIGALFLIVVFVLVSFVLVYKKVSKKNLPEKVTETKKAEKVRKKE